jgi:hypothetical protein
MCGESMALGISTALVGIQARGHCAQYYDAKRRGDAQIRRHAGKLAASVALSLPHLLRCWHERLLA